MLSENQVKFFDLLEQAPYLSNCFCSEDRTYDPEALSELLTRVSHGEKIMAQFFVGLWRNKNSMEFNLFDAANTLDTNNRKIIIDWFKEPFWP